MFSRQKFVEKDDQQSSALPQYEAVRSDNWTEVLNITKISVTRTNAGKVAKGRSIRFKEDVWKFGDGFVIVICSPLKMCI